MQYSPLWKRLLSNRFSRMLGTSALLGALSFGAPTLQAAPTLSVTPSFLASHFWEDLLLVSLPGDAWERLRDNLVWQDRRHDPRVRKWIDHFRSHPHGVVEIIERARPWMAWITAQVEHRNLPGEVSLIPFIESAYDPHARSHLGAAGLWQFMPRTADALGLRRHSGYDGRLDVVAATQAALDYIELQAAQWYAGDIELSLAAYNAGAGTVNRARNASHARGETGDYWQLELPSETMQYLPKLNAVAAIIDDPEAYGIELPEIEDQPAFAKIPVNRTINLTRLANATGLSAAELATLNPALNGSAHPDLVEVLLVPSEQEAPVLAALSTSATPAGADHMREHRVQRGDTLSTIAAQHGTSVDELRRHNGLTNDTIHIGQALSIPLRRLALR